MYDTVTDVLTNLGRQLRERGLDRRLLTECLDPTTYPIIGESRPSDGDVIAYLSQEGITLSAYLTRVQDSLIPERG